MIVLTIARLSILEASRRRLLLAIALLTLAVIAFLGWGFHHLTTIRDHGRLLPVTEVRLLTSQLLILVAFMFSGVLALSAVLVASPAISGDVESGIALAVLARPIRRADVLLGKWLGLGLLVVGFAAATTALALATTQVATGYLPPQPVLVAVFVAAEGLALLTLSLLLSTQLSGMTAGVIALMGFFMAWMGGIVGGIGVALNNATLADVGTASTLLLPSDGLWKGAVYNLEPAALIASFGTGPGARAFPFFAPAPPPTAYLIWVVFWFATLLGLALLSFARKEV